MTSEALSLVAPHLRTYSIPELSEITGVSKSTLYAEIRAGRLRSILPEGRERFQRCRLSAVEEWMAAGEGRISAPQDEGSE